LRRPTEGGPGPADGLPARCRLADPETPPRTGGGGRQIMRCIYCAAFIAGVAAMASFAWRDYGDSGATFSRAGPAGPAQPVIPVAAEAPKPPAADAEAWGTIKGQLVYGGP